MQMILKQSEVVLIHLDFISNYVSWWAQLTKWLLQTQWSVVQIHPRRFLRNFSTYKLCQKINENRPECFSFKVTKISS